MARRTGTWRSSAGGRGRIAPVIALLALAMALGSCGGSQAPPSDTARRVSLSLDAASEEHSKDSHDRRAVLEALAPSEAER